MSPANPADSETAAFRRLKILMLARVLIVTLLLGVSVLIQTSKESSLLIPQNDSVYLLIGLTYFLTIIYAVTLKRIRNVHRFAYGQIVFDTIFITMLVYVTGGIESFFPLAYILTIISASLLLSRRETYVIAAISGILYSGCLVLEYYGFIHPFSAARPYLYGGQDTLYRIFVYFVAFTIVAALVNHLGEQLRTKRRELQQKQLDYEKLEAFHENIVQSLDTGLITTDQSGKIFFLNRTAHRILGIDQSARDSMDLNAHLSKLIAPLSMEPKNSDDIPKREETAFERPDGGVIHLGLSRSSLRDMNGTPVGSILIFQDITRVKEMEEQIKRADRMVSIAQMAAGIAHEVRNPLASLMGSIQVLREDMNPNDTNVNLMEIILRESERLNKLVTDFLLFAQPPRSEFSPIILNQLIDDTLQILRNSPQFNGHITVSRLFSHEAKVLGDAHQLRQVFWNLLLNAAQEMEGGGQLKVKLERDKGTVKLTVSDTGRGIASQDRGKIFEPFFTTKESGTGLGLAIVHRIVENHGGKIRVDSEPGKGTSFIISFPKMTAV